MFQVILKSFQVILSHFEVIYVILGHLNVISYFFFIFSRRNTHKYVSGCCREDLCNANLPLVLNITNTEENNHNSSNLYGSFKLEVLLPIIFSAILLAAIIGLVTGNCTLYHFPQIFKCVAQWTYQILTGHIEV